MHSPILLGITVPKDVLARLRRWKKIMQFHARGYPRGHNLTQYDSWLTASGPYDTQYQPECEPYFISHWDSMPW